MQALAALPAPIQAVVFGGEVPRMDTDAGRRVSAAWQQAGAELAALVQRLDEQIGLLPAAVREELGSRITGAAEPLRSGAAGCSELCGQMGKFAGSSTADSDKEVYTMYAFGVITMYELLVSGGWHPLRALEVLQEKRGEHVARYSVFVAERRAAGAAAAAGRAGLLATRFVRFAVVSALVDPGVQVGQMLGVLDGRRTSMDWRSVWTSAMAGLGANAGGVLGGRFAEVALPQVNSVMLGRALQATVAGTSGVVGGAAAASVVTGRFDVTLSALANGVSVGVLSAHLQASSRPEGVPAASAGIAGPAVDAAVEPVRAGGAGASERLEGRYLPVGDAAADVGERHVLVRGEAGDSAALGSGHSTDPVEVSVREFVSNAGDQAVEQHRMGELWNRQIDETRAAAAEAEAGSVAGPERPVAAADPSEVAHRVAARDGDRAALAETLGTTPEELQSIGPAALQQAAREQNAFFESGFDRLDPPIREAALGDLKNRLLDRARFIAAEQGESASVRLWLRNSGVVGESPETAAGVGWPEIRRVAGREGATDVVDLLDRLQRYGATDAHVAAADPRATDGIGNPAHPSAVAAEPAAAEGANRTADGREDTHGGKADSQQAHTADDAVTGAGRHGAAQSVQDVAARAVAEGVARARAADFAALRRESAQADAGLAKWLGLSDTEFYSMTPSRLQAAVEHWVGRAEGSPEVGEQARAHAGALIGDEVRRAVDADKRSGRFLAEADNIPAGQAFSGDLLGRLQDWAGQDSAVVQRWTEAHMATDRMLASPNLVLRSGDGEPEAPVEAGVEAEAVDRARALHEHDMAETAGSDGSALSAQAAEALVAAGLLPVSSSGATHAGGGDAGAVPSAGSAKPRDMSALSPQAAKALAAAGLLPSAPADGGREGARSGGTQAATDPSSPPKGRGGDNGRPGPVDPVRAAEQARARALREQDTTGSVGDGAVPVPGAKSGSAVTDPHPSAEISHRPGTAGAPARADNAGGSAPGPASADASDHGRVQVLERESPPASPTADPVRQSAMEQPQARDKELAENGQVHRTSSTAPSSDEGPAVGTDTPAESAAGAPSAPVPSPGGSPAASGDTRVGSAPETPSVPAPSPVEAPAAESDTAAESAAGTFSAPASPGGSPSPKATSEHIDATDVDTPHIDVPNPLPAGARPTVPGAVMLGVAGAVATADNADDEAAPQADSTAIPDAGPVDSDHRTRHATQPEDEPADPQSVWREAAEATVAAAQSLQVVPEELWLWGRRPVEQAVDWVEAVVAASRDRGDWDRLDPEARAALSAHVTEFIERAARDLADTHRRAGSVLEWLRAAGLAPDGTVSPVGQRFSLLRLLAAEDPASGLGRHIEALERYLAADTRREALPPESGDVPGGTDRSTTEDARRAMQGPGAAAEQSATGWSLNRSPMIGSPLIAEWVRLITASRDAAERLSENHDLVFDYMALRPGSPELERLYSELDTATAELAQRLGVDAESLKARQIEEICTRPPECDDAEQFDELASRWLLLSSLLETALVARHRAAQARAAGAATSGTASSGENRDWLNRIVQMSPGELSRRWQSLQTIAPNNPRLPGVSSSYTQPPPPLRCLPTGYWRLAGTGRDDPEPDGAGAVRPPDVPRSPPPDNCVVASLRRLRDENGSAALADKLDRHPPEQIAGLDGNVFAQVRAALGTHGWRQPRTWEELVNRVQQLGPGAAAVVFSERDLTAGFRNLPRRNLTDSDIGRVLASARRTGASDRPPEDTGHCQVLFNDRSEPGVVKWSDIEKDGGAAQVFDNEQPPQGEPLELAIVIRPSGEVDIPQDQPGNALPIQRTPLLAVAGTGSDPDPPHRPATSRSSASRSLESTVGGLGQIAKDVVVVGSAALAAMFPDNARPPRDTDLSVPEPAMRHLREHGWTERRLANGRVLLTNGEVEAASGWNGVSHAELAARKVLIGRELYGAGLSDITAAKFRRGEKKDLDDLAWLRSVLFDAKRAPLSEHIVNRYIRKVRAMLPDWVLAHPYAPVAVRLTAESMCTVNALYGDPDIGIFLQIVGEREKYEYLVPASYHNGFGLESGLRQLLQHMENIGAGALERLLAMAADAGSDLKFGGGRMAENPEGYDELISAMIIRNRALQLAPEALYEAQLLFEAVEGTAFDQTTRRQKGRGHPNPVVRAVCGVDLQNLSEYDALDMARHLALEDLSAVRTEKFYERILGRALQQRSARVFTMEDASRFLHEHMDFRPIMGDGKESQDTLRQALGRFYSSNSSFTHSRLGFQYPHDWSVENKKARDENAAKSRLIGECLYNGLWTPRDVDEVIAEHTEIMRRRYEYREQPVAPSGSSRAASPAVRGTRDTADLDRLNHDLVAGDLLAAAVYSEHVDKLRADHGDSEVRQALRAAEQAAQVRLDILRREGAHAAEIHDADIDRMGTDAAYYTRWVAEFKSQAKHVADLMVEAWHTNPDPAWPEQWDRPGNRERLIARLRRYRDGPEAIQRIITHFQRRLRDLEPVHRRRILDSAADGELSGLPGWLLRAISDPYAAPPLAGVFDVPQPDAELGTDRDEIVDSIAEWRVMGESIDGASTVGLLVDAVTRYLDLARLIETTHRMNEEEGLVNKFRAQQEEEFGTDDPAGEPDTGPTTATLARRIEALARVRGLRDRWLELCDEVGAGPEWSPASVQAEFADLATSLTADLQRLDLLPAGGELTRHVARQAEDCSGAAQAIMGVPRRLRKARAAAKLPSRARRYRRLGHLLEYAAECERLDNDIAGELARMRDTRPADTGPPLPRQDAVDWVPLADPRELETDTVLEWSERIAVAAAQRRHLFDRHVTIHGDIARYSLALFEHALAEERRVRADAAAAVAREMLAHDVIDARGGSLPAESGVAIVDTPGGDEDLRQPSPEVFVAGPVTALAQQWDAVPADTRAELLRKGARFHYIEVTVDENGRAYRRDVRPVMEQPVAADDSRVRAPQTPSPDNEISAPVPSRREEWATARAAIDQQLEQWRIEGHEGERVAPCVAFRSSDTGSQLVVAAPEGAHWALLDTVTKRPRFVAARWLRGVDRRYLEVRSGPEGHSTMPVPAGKAEGAFREPTQAELEVVLFEEYLRFLRLGRVTEPFRNWIGEIGRYFRQRDGANGDDLLRMFAYSAAEAKYAAEPDFVADPDLPDPLSVLIRAITRQIRLPVEEERTSGGPMRVVLRGEIDLGPLRPVVELVADGLDWRVAPPRGHGDASAVLHRWLQGRSDRDPDRLLRHIAAELGERSVERPEQEPSRPRRSWQLCATTDSRDLTVDLRSYGSRWRAVGATMQGRDVPALVYGIPDADLPSLVQRVTDRLRTTMRNPVVRDSTELDITLSPEEVRRYEQLSREASAAADRSRAAQQKCTDHLSGLGVTGKAASEQQTTEALWERVSDDRAAVADELGIDPSELASIPLPDNDFAARRNKILTREADLREYLELLGHRSRMADELSQATRRRDDFLTQRVIAAELDRRDAGHALPGGRIALIPDAAGALLLVAAPPGGHMASLSMLAAEQPEYADALWREEFEKQYLEVTLGPDGKIEIRTIPADVAEGRRRRQSAEEVQAQLLDHYLTYRSAGVTPYDARRWLAQLQVGYAFDTPGALLRLGHRMVRADPTIDPAHPARVLDRLWTRRQPPLSVARPEPAGQSNVVTVTLRIGNIMTLRLPLVPADGKWSLATNTGSAVADVLARHLPDHAAGTKSGVLRTINDFLAERVTWDVVGEHEHPTRPKTCVQAAAKAAGQRADGTPLIDVPQQVLDKPPVSGIDARDVSRWARANWHPRGFRDAMAILAHVRRTGGTVFGAVDFKRVGAHAFTVRHDGDGIVVVEQAAHRDADGTVRTFERTVRGDDAVDAWANQLTLAAGEDATFHGIGFNPDGTPELPLQSGREPSGLRGREYPIYPLGERPPERAPPDNTHPAPAQPAARLAVARRVAARSARLRQELDGLLAPGGVASRDLLDTGSPAWADWFAAYQGVRADLVAMLDMPLDRAADDTWIQRALAAEHERGYATSELVAAAELFAEMAPVARLVDDIHRLDTWADTVKSMEAELAQCVEQGRLAEARHLQAQTEGLFELGTALERHEREPLPFSRQALAAAARRYGLSAPDSRPGILLLDARLRHLLETAEAVDDPTTAAGTELLRGWVSHATAAADYYETIHALHADLDHALEHVNRELAGVPEAAPPVPAADAETVADAREYLVHRRRHLSTVLLDVPRSERPNTTHLIHELRSLRRQLTQIDAVMAAMDEARHRIRLGRSRLARMRSDYLRKYPLDRRIIGKVAEFDGRAAGRVLVSTMGADITAVADACAAELLGDGADSPRDEVRRRVAESRRDPTSSRVAYLAGRYVELQRMIDAFEDETSWSRRYHSLETQQSSLGMVLRGWHDSQVNLERAERNLRAGATKLGLDPARLGTDPQTAESPLRLVERELRRLVLVLGAGAPPALRRLDSVPPSELTGETLSPVLADDVLASIAGHPHEVEIRERVGRCLALAVIVDALSDIRDRRATIDRYAAHLGEWLHNTMEVIAQADDPAVAADDGTAEYVPAESHSSGQCVPLTTGLHKERTGNENIHVPTNVGLAGVPFFRYVEFVNGRPQSFPLDAGSPHGVAREAFVDAVSTLPADQRAGASLIVVDQLDTVNEHGVGAHTYRVEYRCDERGNKVRLELQDPGKGLREVWDDTADSTDPEAIWVMAFDRAGNTFTLSGSLPDRPLPATVRIGAADAPDRPPGETSSDGSPRTPWSAGSTPSGEQPTSSTPWSESSQEVAGPAAVGSGAHNADPVPAPHGERASAHSP